MPARHDILVGALDFPWRPWGSIEVWEDAITRALRDRGVTTMLVSDHPHLFETGGENYHTDFNAWHYERGHESDPWRTTPDPTWVGTPTLPVDAGGCPTPTTTPAPTSGPRRTSRAPRRCRPPPTGSGRRLPPHERFFLFVDEFDPHEPFDTPLPYAEMYDAEWEGPLAIWPPYLVDAMASGQLDPRKARHIRANYGAKLTMIDHWFGRLLEAIDEAGLAESTGVVLCTDHGHYLGEHDIFGKPDAPVYSELGAIPLLIRWPGQPPRDVDALTTSVDLHATIADLFGAQVEHPTHGHRSCRSSKARPPRCASWRSSGTGAAMSGVTDGRHRYLRGCGDTNFPLSVWSNRWSTMPIPSLPQLRLPRPDRRATLRLHARHGHAGHLPALRPGRPTPLLGRAPAAFGLVSLRYRHRPRRAGEPTGTAARESDMRRRPGAPSCAAISAPADLLERIGIA